MTASRVSPSKQLAAFIARYDPAIARQARAALARMRRLVPGAVELVYDNWNGLVIGFGPNERASAAQLSLLLLPDHLTLCFLWGATLPDPGRLLRGGGNRVRHVRLADPADLGSPAIRALIRAAIARAEPRYDADANRRLVIKSVSARQRPRRKAAVAPKTGARSAPRAR